MRKVNISFFFSHTISFSENKRIYSRFYIVVLNDPKNLSARKQAGIEALLLYTNLELAEVPIQLVNN